MKKNLIIGSIMAGVVLFILTTFWCAATRFGKDSGVSLTQTSKVTRYMDSTYRLYTDVWIHDFWGMDGTIEYQTSVDVKYCKLDSVKKSEREKAYPVYQKVLAFWRTTRHRKIKCN